ncbi:MAG: DUF992 domain-containing protein [Methylovirgula sp.]
MMLTRHFFRAALIGGIGFAVGFSGLLPASPAAARGQIGVLECNVSPGVGYILTSSRALACRFTSRHGRLDYYVGTINKLGFDVGVTGPGRLVWQVWAPSVGPNRIALAGHYAGATAEASLGAGVGANVLVGGSRRTISLQPLSLNAQHGFNIAAGVAELTLEPAPPPRHYWRR